MKAKFINEKFKEKSDPIEDMGIGDCERKLEKLKDKLLEFHGKYYEMVVEDQNNYMAWEVLDVIQELREITGYSDEDR